MWGATIPQTVRTTNHVRSANKRMRNIEQILASIEGLTLTDEQRSAIVTGVAENYRTKAEVDGKASRIESLEKEIADYRASISKLEGDTSELESLRKQVADYERANAEREQREAEDAKAASFARVFDEAVKARDVEQGNSFANEYARQGILAKVRELCEGNPAISVSDAIDTVTKDVTGIWVNPQKDPAKMPAGDGTQSDKSKEAAAKTIIDFMRG